MTEAETTIVHLHVNNLPAKYFVHRPNIFRKKTVFLTVVKTVLLRLPVSQKFAFEVKEAVFKTDMASPKETMFE